MTKINKHGVIDVDFYCFLLGDFMDNEFIYFSGEYISFAHPNPLRLSLAIRPPNDSA